MNPSIIAHIQDGNVTLAHHPALRHINLTLFAKEHVSLQGNNGAGKSTLLRLLAGRQWLDSTNGGFIKWFPKSCLPETSPLSARTMTALVCAAEQEQALAQNWPMSVTDCLLGGLKDALFVRPGSATKEEEARICKAARLVALEHLLNCPMNKLSQGELRLAFIAKALVREPRILLLDEVTDGLDRNARAHIMNILQALGQHTTLVVSSHRPETVPPWVARHVHMHKGRIVHDGPKDEALQDVQVLAADLTPQTSEEPMAGADICLENATVYLGGKAVLHNINWHIKPREHWFVQGPNGAGKSTLLRTLAGDLHPALGGTIRRTLPRQGGKAISLSQIKRGIRLVSDLVQATYAYNLLGEELVASGFDNAVGIYRSFTTKELQDVQDALQLLDVAHLAKRPFRNCSTGEVRRLLLARGIVGTPDLLLLDEPCSGLDRQGRHDLMQLIAKLMQSGIQIVLVSHHNDDTIEGITRTLRIHNGQAAVCTA